MRLSKLPTTFFPGLAITLGVFIAYYLVMAPSISFWDCGEYAACGASLGILHPPGNPLYLILSRTFSALFTIISDPARRIAVISPITIAFTALFIYLSLVRILTQVAAKSSTDRYRQLLIHASSICGALMAAFAETVAFSSVEAEVNTPLLLPMTLCTWLVLRWAQSTSPHRDRLLVAIAYISFLGIGLHMYSMVILPSVFLYVILVDPAKRRDWPLLLTVAALGLVLNRLSWFIWIGPITTLCTLVLLLIDTQNRRRWTLCVAISLAATLGFSVHMVIPIRSQHRPTIDMGHPATYQAFVDYVDRKQYGGESIITRMFWRRGQLSNQFGVEERMGFGGFWLTQFYRFHPDDNRTSLFTQGAAAGSAKLLLYLIPTALLLTGWYILWKKKQRNLAVLLAALTLTTGVLLVFPYNFADGTRAEKRDYIAWQQAGAQGPMPTVHREVRIRDYFYVAGFMYYGMGIGLAAGLILLAMADDRKHGLAGLVPFGALAVLLLPAIPASYSLRENDRSRDYIPYRYAWNLLQSCDSNAVLFTFGDNDTYPLWALQETFGIRKDIRVVNLSLLNTEWYIKGLRESTPPVPIAFSDREIDDLRPQINPFTQPTPFKLPAAGLPVTLPSRQQKNYILVQNTMVLHIVDQARGKRPIYFTSGAGGPDLLGLERYLVQKGIVYNLIPDTTARGMSFDQTTTDRLIDSVYRFDGFDPWRIERDESSAGIAQMFERLFQQAAYHRLQRAWSIKQQGGTPELFEAEIAQGKRRLEQCSQYFGASPTLTSLGQEFDRLVAPPAAAESILTP